jgi:PAS domain S-box-containing protein
VTLFVGQAGSLKRQRASQSAGFAAVIVAATVLVGWWASLPMLSSWGSGFPPMRPLGALSLAALGLALMRPGKELRFAFVAGFTIAALAAVGLVLALLDFEFGIIGIDRWLALQAAASGSGAASSRVAQVSTLAFGLVGGSLALSRFERHRFAATMLGSIAGAIAVFALLGYLTGIDTLYGSASVLSPPLPATVGLLCVAAGIILRIGAMPALRTPRPLWHLLAMLGCAIIVPLLLFGAYAEVSIADAQLDQVRKDLMDRARALSAQVDREIIGEIERLQALAASPSLRQGDFAAFQRQAEASLALRRSGNIMLIDRDMHQLVNTWVPFGTPLEDAAVPEPAQKALTTGKPQVTGLFAAPVTHQLTFGIIVPVPVDGERRYALVRSPNRHALAGPVAASELPLGWHAVIADASHHIIARSEQENVRVGEELSASERRAGPAGVFEFTDSEGRPSLEAYAWSDLTGWKTVVWEPKALLEAPARALWWTLGLTALLALALVVALALWLGRIIARSVGQAAGAAAALGEGSPPPPGGTPINEINTLMAELRETAARRQAAEDLLRDSERQLRLVTDSAPVSISHCDTEARYKFVNRHLAERHGLTPEQIIGKRVPDVIGDKVFAIIKGYVDECLAGKPVEFEVEAPDHGGEPQFLHCSCEPEWREGKVVGLVTAITNITRLKRAEQRLRASEITFRQLVENSPFGIYAVDADFRIVQVSAGAQKAFENVRPLIGRHLDEALRCIWPEPFASDAIGRFRHTLDSGEPFHSPGSVERRKDTDEVESYDWKIERVTLPDGRLGVVCHFYDLSERQRYEAALRKSEATFRAMFDASSVGKVEIDIETGRFLRANAAMCELVGYSEAELLGRTVFDITHPDERDRDRESLRRMDAGHLPSFDREKRYIRKDGTAVWVRVTANTIRDESGRPLRNTAVIQDLSARKQAEQALLASKDRLQLALDAAQLGWWQYDPLRRMLTGDARANEIFDLDITENEAAIEELMERVHPDDVERFWAVREATLDPLDPKPYANEYRLRRRDGKVRWVESRGLAYFEGAGPERQVVSFVGTVADITERKEREEKEHLLMREINHRAKNMLSVVDAIAHQTAARNPEDFIERFSERIQALSANQDLLVRNEWKGVEIADLARAQLAHFADLIGVRILLHGPMLRLRSASAQAIGLALHELATNAGKYGALSTDAGCVHISWRTDGDIFSMSWTERDGPPVCAPQRRGFGTIVMETMAERSVDGAVALDYAPSGLTWRLTCPAANALETPSPYPPPSPSLPSPAGGGGLGRGKGEGSEGEFPGEENRTGAAIRRPGRKNGQSWLGPHRRSSRARFNTESRGR